MSIATITPPSSLAGLEIAKRHLRLDTDDENDLLELYLAAASAHIDGVAAYLGRAVGDQVLEWRGDLRTSGSLCLPGETARAIISIKYPDTDGVVQTVPVDAYELVDGELIWGDAPWPTDARVSIRYQAGYLETPKPIVAAVLLMMADLFAFRETVSPGGASAIPMSTTVENLLRPFRVLSV